LPLVVVEEESEFFDSVSSLPDADGVCFG
jgi:hypothetical protein